MKPVWAIVTVQGILDNDFYIGTLRQGKYTRRKINGKDVRRDEEALEISSTFIRSLRVCSARARCIRTR